MMEDQLDGRRPSLRFRVSIARSGLRERAYGAGIVGRAASPVERARAGALLVLCAWSGFVIAGASFSKLSEHFDAALPRPARGLPWIAYREVQIVAAIAVALLVTAGLCVVPAFARFLGHGGWQALRRPVLRATTLTVGLVAATVALAVWAHSLSAAQRNGADAAYSAAFVVWALVAATTLVLWTRAAVVAGRRLELSRRVLAAVSALAVAVGAAMAAMTVNTAIWWGTMAERAPWFLHGAPLGTNGSPFNPQLAGTMGLMLASVVVGEYGVSRIGRSWVELARSTPSG